MSHLIAIAVGPVQEFIAAARRTRDLWFGSYLLSEISRAVARSVETNGGKLIFPASADAENVANVILAELPAAEPGGVADKAEQAAKERWREFANEAYNEAAYNKASDEIRQDIWNDQVKDVIEFYAAWVQQTADYKADRGRLMRLLAGRKNCRDFQANRITAPLPKSSLDGQRETVLSPERRELARMLRLSSGEQLDVVGLVKRLGHGHQPFPSVMRVAADPWVRGNASRTEFSQLRSVLMNLPNDCLHRIDEKRFPQFRVFPFEGIAVYRNRHPQWAEETNIDGGHIQHVQKLLKELPDPGPYLAVLVADGDRMGAAISALTSPDANREFSSTLAGFANSARRIVNDHNGVLVYAGGDDVLAFLPVDKCLSCARKLHDDFGQRLAQYGQPTLSVGLAIGHCMENLEDLLDYGRDAEKAAKKPDRDGLAVHLHKRGGAPIGVRVRARWNDNLDHRLERFANLMNEGIIPTKLPYELRAMANLYKPWAKNGDAVIQQDLYRLIAKKTSRGPGTVRDALSEYVREMDSNRLMILAHELLVARQIAVAFRQAAGRGEEVPA